MERGGGEKGKERNANVTNMEERECDPERNETGNEFAGEQWVVNYTGGEEDVSCDLGWAKYGITGLIAR